MICFYGSFHVKRHNKIVILTLITCINITIPLYIFSKVKNSNYNENDFIYEITDTHLI